MPNDVQFIKPERILTKNWDELIACAKREAAMRRQVYPRRVVEGRMPEAKAAHELKCMDEIVMVLERVRRKKTMDPNFKL